MKKNAISTLCLRLPSRSAGKTTPQRLTQPVSFALVSANGRLTRCGQATLSSLSASIAQVQRVVLMLAASDVTLLRLAVPPMSAARLRAALPGLVEERLITDPADCVLVAGPAKLGMRSIAVVERQWLQSLVTALTDFGARHLLALPVQLCMPRAAAGMTAAVMEMPEQIDLALRMSEDEGMGLPIVAPAAGMSTQSAVCQTLLALAAEQKITLMVPAEQVEAYRAAAEQLVAQSRQITVCAENWQEWIDALDPATLDLMRGLHAADVQGVDWRRWRWPLGLAALLLVTNVAALNWDWWRMKSEGEELRLRMTHIYKTTFPNDAVIIDPLAQMQKKSAAVRQAAGEINPQDFTPMAANFAEVWRDLKVDEVTDSTKAVAASAAKPQIAGLAYRDATLLVRFKPGAKPSMEAARIALAARKLSLTEAPSEGETTVWQIRSVP